MSTATTKKNIPELRFPGFSTDWKSEKLLNVLFEHKTRNTKTKYEEVFSVAKNKGIINQIEHLGRSYAAENLENYKVVFPDDVVYTKSPTADFPFGIIKQNKLNRAGVVSTLYAVYRPRNKYIGGLLNEYFLSWIRTYNYLVPLVQKGAKNTINIGNKDFLNGAKIFLPPTEDEQKKLMNFFEDTDALIKNLKHQKEKLEEYKRGIMQKIFSQEVRFKDDGGKDFPKWQTVKLGDLFIERTERAEKNSHELLSVTMNNGITRYNSSAKKDGSSKDKSNYKVVRVGDIAYNTMRMWQGASGVSQYEGIVSPAYTVVTPKDGDSDFFGYLFKMPRVIFNFYRYSQGLVSDTWNLKFRHFSEVEVTVPTSVQEQIKIKDFIKSVDELIVFKSMQIEKAKTWKKGLLQKMFI